MKIVLLTLQSNNGTPYMVTEDELKGMKETKMQYSGSIRSEDPEYDGFKRTRINKSKLHKIRLVKNSLFCIEMEAWTTDEDTTAVTFNLQEKFKEIINEQEKQVAEWQELHNLRKSAVGL